MWNRRSRRTISEPRVQMTIIGQSELPHWTLSVATVAGARKSIALTPRFDGFQRWRPCQRIAYFDVIEIRLHRAYGQKAGERIRMPTLIPEMYALARWGHLPTNSRARINSMTMLHPIAR